MSVEFPQIDCPRRVRGGSFAWDLEELEQLLGSDFYEPIVAEPDTYLYIGAKTRAQVYRGTKTDAQLYVGAKHTAIFPEVAVVVELAVRTAVGAGRALPSGCDTFYGQDDPVTYGSFTVEEDGGTFTHGDAGGPAGGQAGLDPRLDGLYILSPFSGQHIKVTCPNGTYRLWIGIGRSAIGGSYGFKIEAYTTNSTLVSSRSAEIPTGSVLDATGAVLSAANFFANQGYVDFTVTDGGFRIWDAADGCALNWFKVQKIA